MEVVVLKHPCRQIRFPDLLRAVADIDPELRVRFTSPHPKDFPDEVLDLIAERPNLCASLHLPVSEHFKEFIPTYFIISIGGDSEYLPDV